MARKSRNRGGRPPYQTKNPDSQSEPYTAIYMSMSHSPAWLSLNGDQRDLYRFCLERYTTNPFKEYPDAGITDPEEIARHFFMNWALAKCYVGRSKNTFYANLKILCDRGFIKRKYSGHRRGDKSLYEYSEDWKNWKQK